MARVKNTLPGSGLDGQVVASHGRHQKVELADGTVLDCVTRSRRRDIVCGDRVTVAASGTGQGVIEEVTPRSSLLYRSVAHREKLIAANVTQIAIVVAPRPPASLDLVNRCIAAAEHGGMKVLIIANKSDLEESAALLASLELYRDIGYPIVQVSAKRDIGVLLPVLSGETSVLVGQSGMGKSTIINRLVPEARARTAEISVALGAGRHTTTHAELYHLDPQSHIIDSPGMQAFGLHHLDQQAAAEAFREFRPLIGTCRFRDCRHLTEPGCAIANACEAGQIAPSRLASYRTLAGELAQPSA
jgi:ribosome biogenesis GTPase